MRAGGCPTATIHHQMPKDLSVVADRLQVQQVVINLLRNACDAVGETAGGCVKIGASLNGTEVVVSVADTGPGLPSRSEDAFEWTDSSKEGGMGLGLSISRTMVEAQHGSIWVERSDQSGSVFCFSVPAAGPESGGRHGA